MYFVYIYVFVYLLFIDHVSPDLDLGVRIVSWWIHEHTSYLIVDIPGNSWKFITENFMCLDSTLSHLLPDPSCIGNPCVELCDILSLSLFSTREHELDQGECTVLCCTVLHCAILHCVLFCTILHFSALCSVVLNYSAQYCTLLYCTVL